MPASSRISRAIIVVAAVVIGAPVVSAHRLDECLQAARIDVEPSGVDVNLTLTPGAAVADALIADIDRDRDRSLSSEEQRAYVDAVLATIEVRVDGQPLRLTARRSTFADVAALTRGEGTIQLHLSGIHARLSNGPHQVVFRNAYRRDISVYLANAVVPTSNSVAVTAQRRETEQRELTIDYVVGAQVSSATLASLLGGLGVAGLALVVMMRPRVAAALRR